MKKAGFSLLEIMIYLAGSTLSLLCFTHFLIHFHTTLTAASSSAHAWLSVYTTHDRLCALVAQEVLPANYTLSDTTLAWNADGKSCLLFQSKDRLMLRRGNHTQSFGSGVQSVMYRSSIVPPGHVLLTVTLRSLHKGSIRSVERTLRAKHD